MESPVPHYRFEKSTHAVECPAQDFLNALSFMSTSGTPQRAVPKSLDARV
jgi:hypothetical protein